MLLYQASSCPSIFHSFSFPIRGHILILCIKFHTNRHGILSYKWQIICSRHCPNTQQCLDELKALALSDPESPPRVLVSIGRVGTGKSAYAEDISGLLGYSQQSLEAVTQRCELAKVAIEGKTLFIMDTPGFEPAETEPIFREIVRGIQTVFPISQIVGFLYFTGISPPRFDSVDREVLQVVRAMSGDHYIPYVTFITTFWTADYPPQQASLNEQFDFLKDNWLREFGVQALHLYEHGRGYTAEGEVTQSFINWYGPSGRNQMAQHAKDVIVRRYCGPNASTDQEIIPNIVQELRCDTPIHETDAGRILGLEPVSFGEPSSTSNEQRQEFPDQQSSSTSSGSSTGSDREQRQDADSRDKSRASQARPENSQSLTTRLTETALEMICWGCRNINSNGNFGGSIGGMSFTMGNGPRGPGPGGLGPGGGMSEGMLFDTNSSMDWMNYFKLDSSPVGRVQYAAEHGIGGEPFSAQWGEAIRQDVMKRFGRGRLG